MIRRATAALTLAVAVLFALSCDVGFASSPITVSRGALAPLVSSLSLANTTQQEDYFVLEPFGIRVELFRPPYKAEKFDSRVPTRIDSQLPPWPAARPVAYAPRKREIVGLPILDLPPTAPSKLARKKHHESSPVPLVAAYVPGEEPAQVGELPMRPDSKKIPGKETAVADRKEPPKKEPPKTDDKGKEKPKNVAVVDRKPDTKPDPKDLKPKVASTDVTSDPKAAKAVASFQTFASDWVEKVDRTYTATASKVELVTTEDGKFVARYYTVKPNSLEVTLKTTEYDHTPYIGVMKYQKQTFESEGASKEAAVNGNFVVVKEQTVREIFRYAKNKWQY